MSLISIVSSNFNKADFISEMIESVIRQTYSNWELIIIDDCSTDNSVQIISDFVEKDSRIKLIENQVNKGGNFSRNLGLSIVSGDYVIFMDSDDLFTDLCFENRIKFASQNPNYDLWVFPMGVFKQTIGDCSENLYWKIEQKDFLKSFLSHNLPWQTCQPLWSFAAIKSLGGFDETFIRLQDVELHTRALLKELRVFTAKKVGYNCYFRIDEQRIELSSYGFLSNFIAGAIQYYSKFYSIIDDKQKKIIGGTLLETLGNVCFHKRIGKISQKEFLDLSNKLIESCSNRGQKRMMKYYVAIEKNSPFHPKGLKKIIKLLSGV